MTGLHTYSSAFLDRLRNRLDTGNRDAGPVMSTLGTTAAAAPETGPAWVAAAVNHVFTPQNLPGNPDAAVLSDLARDSVPAPGYWAIRGRILARAHRKEILNGLGLDGIRTAIEQSDDRIETPAQAMFEALVRGEDLVLDRLSRLELVALGEVLPWLNGIMDLPFSDKEIEIAITRSDAWAPFSHLLGQSFVGREDNIRVLGRFIGLKLEKDGTRTPADPPETRLLFMGGVGGIGKSALIAHFLARIRDAEGLPFSPFAYIAADDPAVDVTETDLLLTEAADQIWRHVKLYAQAGKASEALEKAERAYEDFKSRISQQANTVELATKRTSSSGSLDLRLDALRKGSQEVAAVFCAFAGLACQAMQDAKGPVPPALIVIDTFEEVRYRSSARLLPFWRVLEQLVEAEADIRVIISGRAPLPQPQNSLRSAQLALTELSREAAVDLLGQDTDLDPDVLDRLAQQIGGNPLNLRLAARVVSGEQPGRYGISGLTSRRWGFFRVSEELIRGQLYRRVLDHIHDPRVRTLAHPGMVLRRITPEIIEDVLAPVCDIELDDGESAGELFTELAKEHTLVRRGDDEALYYRDDVRRPVLELLSNDQPELTRRVHEAAFHHYSDEIEAGTPDLVDHCEAIYHGIMLGLDAASLDAFWVKEVNTGLESAIDELPAEGKVWLAGRMDISLPEEFYREAGTAEWERMIGPRALAVLQEAGSLEVLSMLSEREERTSQSPLVSIEARCLVSIGDYSAAEELLVSSLEASPINGNPGRRAEYLWLLAKTYLERGDRDLALRTLRDLAEVAGSLASPLPLVQTLSSALSIAPGDDPSVPLFRSDLVHALLRCSDAEISREPDVVRRGFSKVDPSAAPRLPRCALASLSGLYDIVVRSEAFKPTASGMKSILEIAGKCESEGRDGVRDLGRELQKALDPDQLRTSSFLEAFNALRRPLVEARDDAPDPAGAIAAQVVWHLLQMETTSLATATLAGIDEYRMNWEVETNYQAAAV